MAASALFLVNLLLKAVSYRFPALNRLVEGKAVMLVYQGQLIMENAVKARLTHAEIMEAIREHGVLDIREVDLCVLEVDGNISVISHGYQQTSQHKRKTKKTLQQTTD